MDRQSPISARPGHALSAVYFDGAHYQLAHPVDSPGPVQRPHPRILVGGAGERKTLRLVARYADACNLFDIPDGGKTIRHKLDVLARHCDEVGRPFDDVERTVCTRMDADEPQTTSYSGAPRCRSSASTTPSCFTQVRGRRRRSAA